MSTTKRPQIVDMLLITLVNGGLLLANVFLFLQSQSVANTAEAVVWELSKTQRVAEEFVDEIE